MDQPRDVAVIVGSLRKASINRMVANALAELAPAGLKLGIVEIGQLPLYNQDGDDDPPAEWTAFRERVRAADSVLFVTPEYNRSVPAALKNALDVGSRPYGKSAWSGKPGAVVSASPGGIGGWRQPSSETVVGISRRARDAATGSLYRRRRQTVRRGRKAGQRGNAEIPSGLHAVLCRVGVR